MNNSEVKLFVLYYLVVDVSTLFRELNVFESGVISCVNFLLNKNNSFLQIDDFFVLVGHAVVLNSQFPNDFGQFVFFSGDES